MFCPKCGNQNANGAFCTKCGTPLNGQAAPGGQPTPPPQPQPYQQPPYQQPYQQPYAGPQPFPQQPPYPGMPYGGATCSFDGTGGEFFGIYLVSALLLTVTCGFAFPWVTCRLLKWTKSHTLINGRRLAFTGQAGDLLKNWLIWWLLSLVTCGIYAIWVSVKVKEWEMSHTCYADMNPVEGQTFADSFYDGAVGERFGQQLVANLLLTLTCGIAAPWMVVRMRKFDFSHTVICGDRLQFNGTGAGYWGETQLVSLLSAVTCGIYYAWGVCKINQWIYRNTVVVSRGNYKIG